MILLMHIKENITRINFHYFKISVVIKVIFQIGEVMNLKIEIKYLYVYVKDMQRVIELLNYFSTSNDRL